MTSKQSAFNVFKSKDRSRKATSLEIPKNNGTLPEDDQPKLVFAKRRKSLPHVSNLDMDENMSCPSTLDLDNISKRSLRIEPRLSSIRKSFCRKIKKDSHHDVSLKTKGGKENKLHKAGSYLQVFDCSNWTESLQSLNSSSLEEAFLPEVAKQKKEQKHLHGDFSHAKEQLKSCSESEIKNTTASPNGQRKRSNSQSCGEPLQKPPIPVKKVKPSEQKKFSSPDKNEKQSDVEEKGGGTFSSSAEKLFAWVVAPIKPDLFFSDVWQKKPLFIKRRQPKYNNVWFSTTELDRIFRQQNVQFTKDLDIAVYRHGKRETLNPAGRAFAPTVWKFYEEGCSIRLLNPQTFSKNVWHLSAKLQELFGCFVGSNVYLTPPCSQGFAPHYDDIEAFIIQLEGKKHWKLYSSRNMNEILPRYSSKHLSQEELGEPILDRVLEPGDTLYFPRGVIHQAVTPEDSHSLHITLSFYQKYSWSDFMEKLVPMALQTAIEEDVEFRKGLPLGFHNHVGVAYSDKMSDERKSFLNSVEQLMKKLVSYVAVDEAADELVLDQMEEFLPPSLNAEEADSTVQGNGAFWGNGAVHGQSDVTLNSEVRLVRPGIIRLIPSGDIIQIHHTLESSRQYKEVPLQVMEIPTESADAAECMLLSYPNYVRVKDVPIDNDEDKLSLARKLYAAGLLRTKEPLM